MYVLLLSLLTGGTAGLAFFLYTINRGKQSMESEHSLLKIGHRGASGYCPENTMASFKKAAELGADLIELDIQLTKDGRLAVHHDPDIKRTTNGKGLLKNFSSSELRHFDAGSWFSQAYAGERIPHLEEVLGMLPETGLLIEIKSSSPFGEIEKQLACLLQDLPAIPPNVFVQSFDTSSVRLFHELMPEVPAGVLLKARPRRLSERKVKEYAGFAAFLNIKKTMVNRRNIRLIHKHGLKVFTWTVNSKKQIRIMKMLGVDGITTDFPDYM